jgi:hypothetical protein
VSSAPLENLSQWDKPLEITHNHPDTARFVDYLREHQNLPPDEEPIFNAPPRIFHATPDKLYLWCDSGQIFWTDDAKTWQQMPMEEIERLRTEGLSTSNKNFARLRDGRLMAFNFANGGLWCPTTADPTGLSGWQGDPIDSRDCPDVGEPGGWEGPDGVLHGTSRCWQRIYHACSRDGGESWSRLTLQPDFPDCPGNKDFGALPDGSVWYVGNPVPGSRDQLVLAISGDGWRFEKSWLVRWEPSEQLYPGEWKSRGGYQYPDAAYDGGILYIAYSLQRDGIEVSTVNWGELQAANRSNAWPLSWGYYSSKSRP